MMQINRKIILAGLAGIAVIGALVFFLPGWLAGGSQQFVLSGTIEANEVHLSTRNGGVIKQVYIDEGEPVRAGQNLAQVFSPGPNMDEEIISPINGVLLERLFEPGELAEPGNVVMVVADLSKLNLKVYAPEDQYGQFTLGQVYPVTVDSFPNTTFSGRISQIAEQAEFTPRNVTTIQGRKSTVFAITLDIENNGDTDNLIPGMPADVHFAGN
ncbi:MAG: efflux RND transporter periplasmic adaptor subunit [Anaerolineaceae bacterium]|nr:efflux RND transporter periplasmic adaptor subunit [Anaerolineaceae bacterium]